MSFFRITLYQIFRGRSFQNTFVLEDETSLKTQDLIAQLVAQHWIPMFNGLQFSNMVYSTVEVKRIGVVDPPATTLLQVNINATGSLTAALGPNSIKLIFRTGLAGKKHRGRYFIAGIAQGHIDGTNEAVGSQGTNLLTVVKNTILDKWCDGPNTVGLHLCIGHKQASLTPTRVDQVLWDPKICWLRSRKLGIGI